MRLLILTDHATHSSSNSFYLIANACFAHPEIQYVAAASRGYQLNKDFFDGATDARLFGVEMNANISIDSYREQALNSAPLVLEDFDAILLRLPRPVSPAFFEILIEQHDDKIIVNDPDGIIRTSSKAFLTTLDQFVPECGVCNTWEEVMEVANRFPIVLKPLEEYGGKGLLRVDATVGWIGSEQTSLDEVEKAFKTHGEPMLAMEFLKNVALGDKRIVVVEGQILTVSVRYPAAGNWLCNVAQGGSAEQVEADARDRSIVEYLHPIMHANGIFAYGVDTLVGNDGLRVISELNTLSVGGIAPAEENTGVPLTARFANSFVDYYKSKRASRN